jgi:hypothetical protein
MTTYTLETCENYINKYVNEYGGDSTTLEEGSLGLGTVLLHGAEGKKISVIKEVYLNAWSSGHTIRQYNNMPKKYEKLLEKVENSFSEDEC